MHELTKIVTRLGGAMAQEERRQWIAVVAIDLLDVPGTLTISALRESKRECTRLSEIVAFVFRFADTYPEIMRNRLRRYVGAATALGIEI